MNNNNCIQLNRIKFPEKFYYIKTGKITVLLLSLFNCQDDTNNISFIYLN